MFEAKEGVLWNHIHLEVKNMRCGDIAHITSRLITYKMGLILKMTLPSSVGKNKMKHRQFLGKGWQMINTWSLIISCSYYYQEDEL